MDQCGSAVGGFMTIDFENPKNPVIRALGAPLEQGGLHVVITRAGGTHADLTPDYAAIPVEMRQVAAALGHSVLREVDPARFYADYARLRAAVGDRAMLRAMHFLAENERVRIAADALEEADLDCFLEQIRTSGRSSDMLLQNVWTATSPREQPIAVATALSEHLLAGAGASRVHGGGFAGTMQSFVPEALLADYVAGMEAVFGKGSVLPINVRPLGACAVPLDIWIWRRMKRRGGTAATGEVCRRRLALNESSTMTQSPRPVALRPYGTRSAAASGATWRLVAVSSCLSTYTCACLPNRMAEIIATAGQTGIVSRWLYEQPPHFHDPLLREGLEREAASRQLRDFFAALRRRNRRLARQGFSRGVLRDARISGELDRHADVDDDKDNDGSGRH